MVIVGPFQYSCNCRYRGKVPHITHEGTRALCGQVTSSRRSAVSLSWTSTARTCCVEAEGALRSAHPGPALPQKGASQHLCVILQVGKLGPEKMKPAWDYILHWAVRARKKRILMITQSPCFADEDTKVEKSKGHITSPWQSQVSHLSIPILNPVVFFYIMELGFAFRGSLFLTHYGILYDCV